MTDKLEDLKQAAEDAEKAKKVVLQILKSQGTITFDTKDALDETWRELIKGKG